MLIFSCLDNSYMMNNVENTTAKSKLTKTSEQRPPLDNVHKFSVPRVVVVHRMSLIHFNIIKSFVFPLVLPILNKNVSNCFYLNYVLDYLIKLTHWLTRIHSRRSNILETSQYQSRAEKDWNARTISNLV